MTWQIAVLLGLFILFLIELYISNNVLQISHFHIKNKKIGKNFQGYKIVHLSDLHGKRFGKDNQTLIQIINDIRPDIIVMTGDMINGVGKDYNVFTELIQNLSSFPMYFVLGNHEDNLKVEKQKMLFDYLSNHNVKILDNEEAIIENGEEKISLFGVWCDSNYYKKKEGQKPFTIEVMNSLMKAHPNESCYSILLAHNPNYFETYAKWGADLMLCGHVHGGMVRVPFVGGVFSPDTLFFPKYSKGIYTLQEKTMVVSRGLGRGMRGFRLFNRPELGVIILENESEE